jgi:hypothetical protein
MNHDSSVKGEAVCFGEAQSASSLQGYDEEE